MPIESCLLQRWNMRQHLLIVVMPMCFRIHWRHLLDPPYPNARPQRVKMEELARKFLDRSLLFNVSVQQDTLATDVRPSWIRAPQTRARMADCVSKSPGCTSSSASACLGSEKIFARRTSTNAPLRRVATDQRVLTRSTSTLAPVCKVRNMTETLPALVYSKMST